MKILIIGARASGKTTIGRALAERTGRPFVDLDDVARARFDNLNVMEIWRQFGEPAWREAEESALCDLLSDGRPLIIALGGGAVMRDGVRTMISEHVRADRCKVIYLACNPTHLAERLRLAPGDRPSLTGRPIEEEVDEVLRARRPIYESLADTTIDTSSISIDDAVARLIPLTTL